MLAVADACNSPDGTGAWLSNAALQAKTGLSERAVRVAVRECEELGELKVEIGRGRGGVNRFMVIMSTRNPAESAPFSANRQNLPGAESAPGRTDEGPQANAGKPADSAGKRAGRNPAESAPGTVSNSRKSSKRRPRSTAKQEPHREDVERVCKYLAAWMVRNGCKPPNISEKWREAARLLIDKDKRSLEDVRDVTAWSQRSTFWKANILSLPTLREKFDQLRLAKESEEAARNGHATDRQPRGAAAPKPIPASEQCPDHRGQRKGTRPDGQPSCGLCRAEQGTATTRRTP